MFLEFENYNPICFNTLTKLAQKLALRPRKKLRQDGGKA